LDSDYQADFRAETVEWQQIATRGRATAIVGARYQGGLFDTRARLTNLNPGLAALFGNPPAPQEFTVRFARLNAYAYGQWRIAPQLSVTGGATFDRLEAPDNFRSPPINPRQRTLEQVSPKLGFVLQPRPDTVVRGAYLEAISGASFDESVRLEPTQVAGFVQAYRSLAPESLIGSVAGSKYALWGLSLEHKLGPRTFVGAGYDDLGQRLGRTIGVFDFLNSGGGYPNAILPSSVDVRDNYHERILNVTVNHLVGERWSFGAGYRETRSTFDERVPVLLDAARIAAPSAQPDLARSAARRFDSELRQLRASALYNHPSGFFARAEASWFAQQNRGFLPAEPGDEFSQVNIGGGYRFFRNQCELGFELLNLGGGDYRLEPLTPYRELPRARTLGVRARFGF
jgi:hypothetical protein